MTAGLGSRSPRKGNRMDLRSSERLATLLDQLRTTFGFPAAIAMGAGVVAGLGVPELDNWLAVEVPLFGFSTQDAARGLLETVATATVSVAGIAFSVTIVAFTLSANQLSPRVLRSFRRDLTAQLTLAAFLGTFIYCLAVLVRLGALGEGRLPYLAVATAIALALISFAMFALFIGHIASMLQPSSIIASITADARELIAHPFPAGLGDEPQRPEDAVREVERRREREPAGSITHPDEGFVTAVHAAEIVALAARGDGLVRQCVPVGAYVLPGQAVAETWPAHGEVAEEMTARIEGLFELGAQRTLPQDVGFPVRQLADVALRGLSPAMSDPTTAVNALEAMTGWLLRVASAQTPSPIRVDSRQIPRLITTARSLDELVAAGFSQPLAAALDDTTTSDRIRELLVRLAAAACERGLEHRRIDALLGRMSGD